MFAMMTVMTKKMMLAMKTVMMTAGDDGENDNNDADDMTLITSLYPHTTKQTQIVIEFFTLYFSLFI